MKNVFCILKVSAIIPKKGMVTAKRDERTKLSADKTVALTDESV